MDSVLSCLVSDENGDGAYRDKFLALARESLGYEACVAFRTSLDALGMAFDCLSLEPGAKIAISALSPAYYERVITGRGFACLYADVDADSAQVTEAEISRLMALGARAVILYEPFGMMPDMEKIAALGIPVIEDISQSMGAFSGTAKAGSLAAFTLLSMEHGGIISSGGGALLYSCQKRESTVLKNAVESLPAEILLSDMNAALAFTQFKESGRFFEKRKELYSIMSRPILQSRHRLLVMAGDGESAWYGFPVVLKSGLKDVRAYARKKEIETEEAFGNSVVARGFVPEGECPAARSLAMRCLLFPLHPGIGKTQTQKIVKVLATLP